jgi:hypothetical protein
VLSAVLFVLSAWLSAVGSGILLLNQGGSVSSVQPHSRA